MTTREYSVFYTYQKDPTEYRTTVKAVDDHDADRKFRASLSDDEMWIVTVTRIERQ